MSYFSKHGWETEGSVEESLTFALTDHLVQSHLTRLWMPEELCSRQRLEKGARQFIKQIKTPIDDAGESSDNWSADVSGTEGKISIASTLEAGQLSIQMRYTKVTGPKTEDYAYYCPGLPFAV